MTMPAWWSERRFGLLVLATAAAVPGWAPIGEYADRYRGHLGDDVDDDFLHPHPLVEVLAHHRDRWGHVDDFDDFVPLLTFEHFDAEAWAQLVSDAGANYSVLVAKHHDGWTWWDAPGSTRPLTEDGPHRNVLAEYAAACERHGISLGTYYSLVDRGDPRSLDGRFVDEIVHPQVIDLVERHGSVMLWGDGHRGNGDSRRKTTELMEHVRAIDPDVVINDRWPISDPDVPGTTPAVVRTFEYDAPDDIVDGPWELTRGIGFGFGYNRAERREHHLTGRDIVALYTEVLAKGGNLLLSVGPDADGIIPDLQSEPLREAGVWIRRHGSTLAATSPWDHWGDDGVRYLRVTGGGAAAPVGELLVVDLAGTGSFPALGSVAVQVTGVSVSGGRGNDTDLSPGWRQDEVGLHVEPAIAAAQHVADVAVYRVSVDAADRPQELFTPVDPDPVALGPLVADARPGEIVQLGDGTYRGPIELPPGVILRGLGPDRTTITSATGDGTSVGAAPPTVTVAAGARVEHVRIATSTLRSERPVVSLSGASAVALGCIVAGTIEVRADDVLLRAVSADRLVGVGADRLHVSRCNLTGNGWDVGIELRSGGGQHLDSNRLSGHLCSIRLSETTGSTVRGNTVSGRWWGIHLDHCERAHVHGNRVTWTMRAVDVDGGTQAVIDGNAVTDGDSGCIVEDGASDCEVYGNHWDRCRIGLLAWDAVSLHHQDNVSSSLHEADGAFIQGP